MVVVTSISSAYSAVFPRPVVSHAATAVLSLTVESVSQMQW